MLWASRIAATGAGRRVGQRIALHLRRLRRLTCADTLFLGEVQNIYALIKQSNYTMRCSTYNVSAFQCPENSGRVANILSLGQWSPMAAQREAQNTYERRYG